MNKIADGRRRQLRLNRETVRVLSAMDLARAGGGSDMPPVIQGHPKSNAWTGDLIQPCH